MLTGCGNGECSIRGLGPTATDLRRNGRGSRTNPVLVGTWQIDSRQFNRFVPIKALLRKHYPRAIGGPIVLLSDCSWYS